MVKTFKRKSRRLKRRANYRAKRTKYSRYKKPYVPKFRAPLGNFPNTKTVALRYVENFTLDASATATAVQVFTANSIFDPNYTGGGHQPMFRDNYAALYSNYRVNYATITVVPLTTHIVNNAYSNQTAGTTTSTSYVYAANERGCRLWILRDDTSNDYPANIDTLVEEGNTNFVWRYCPQNTSQKMPILRFQCYPHRILNCSPRDDQLKSLVSGNPDNLVFFIVGISTIGGSANPDPVACQAIITYNVTFSDPVKNQTEN